MPKRSIGVQTLMDRFFGASRHDTNGDGDEMGLQRCGKILFGASFAYDRPAPTREIGVLQRAPSTGAVISNLGRHLDAGDLNVGRN